MLHPNPGKTLGLSMFFLLKCPHMGAKMQGLVTFVAVDDIQQSNHAICIKVSSMKIIMQILLLSKSLIHS